MQHRTANYEVYIYIHATAQWDSKRKGLHQLVVLRANKVTHIFHISQTLIVYCTIIDPCVSWGLQSEILLKVLFEFR